MSEPGQDDERPRPRYGEYATPEEQRARIRDSDPLGTLRAPEQAAPPAPAGPPAGIVPPAGGFPQGGPGIHGGMSQPAAQRTARGRLADRIATFALLGYGLINVLLTLPGLLEFGSIADVAFEVAGIPGEFTNDEQGRLWGMIAAVVLAGGYLLTVWLSWRRLRSGKLTWWIPLVGAVATQIVVTVCMLVPLLGDPAFLAYISSAGS